MNELINFELEKEILYCPLCLNSSILANHQSLANIPETLEEEVMKAIFTKIDTVLDYFFIVDFSGFSKCSITDDFLGKIFQNKVALYVNAKIFKVFDEIIEKKKYKNLNYKKYKDDNNMFLIWFSEDNKLGQFIEKQLQVKKNISLYLHKYILAKFFLEDIEKNNHKYDIHNLKYLESSNVYVNCYINIKALFLQLDYLYLVIHDLKKLIVEYFISSGDKDDFCLLGVSNNGIILSRLLAYELQMDVKSINHIGPHFFLESDDEKLTKFKNNKYILVSDVICLGGEYRMAKGMLEMLNSQLCGAISVVKIRDVYRNSDIEGNTEDKNICIYSLLNNINQYEINGKSLNYKIFIDKEC